MNLNASKNDISVDDDAELLALEKLLAETDESVLIENGTQEKTSPTPKIVEKTVPRLREDSTFAEAFSYEIDLPTTKLKEAENAVRTEELDSSDDEEVKNFLERKYNEYGSDINKKLKEQRIQQTDAKVSKEVNIALKNDKLNSKFENSSVTNSLSSSFIHVKNPHNPIKRQSTLTDSFQKATPKVDSPKLFSSGITSATFVDPVFGLRIINPLISSSLLTERMSGKKHVGFASLAFHIQRGDLSKDWVIAGVIVNKAPIKISKKGDPFSKWRISDLRGQIALASLFLFKGAHKDLWKTAEGMCIAILNPGILEKRAESGDVACLSIDTSQKVMILGQSKDFGTCRAKKKNGDPCSSIVNLGECDYCIFHMKQEFTKMSRRSELQSSTSGRGLNELRNKVLGKNEVFYGGQSYLAIPAKKSAKLVAKDSQRMSSLSEFAVSPFASSINHTSKPKSFTPSAIPYAAKDGPISKLAANVDISRKQRLKDLERLKILQGETSSKSSGNDASLPTSFLVSEADKPNQSAEVKSSTAINSLSSSFSLVPDKFKNREFSSSPKLSRENFCIEVHIGERKAAAAKAKAAQVLKQKPVEKVNPNSTRGTKDGKRRAIDDLNEKFLGQEAKRRRMEEEEREAANRSRIDRIINATSSHTNLIDMREQEEQEKYFNKLEKKEALEEKMLNTYKIPCKAVICQRCKYTAFSASDKCKQEKHPLKVVDAVKRFFQCKDCGNRTTTVFKVPKLSCSNCKGSHWLRTAMIRERKIHDGSENLSIRGDEEKFIGSLAGSASLNLLVPEE